MNASKTVKEVLLLGTLMERFRGSERVVVENAARHVLFRGYAGNFETSNIDKTRRVEQVSTAVETYRKTDNLWDWSNINNLPEEIPMECISEFEIGDLKQIIYTRIRLVSDFS